MELPCKGTGVCRSWGGEVREETITGKEGLRASAKQETVSGLLKSGGVPRALETAFPHSCRPLRPPRAGQPPVLAAGTPSSHSFPSPLDGDTGVPSPALSWIFACLIEKPG